MSARDVLEQALAVRGVTAAALARDDGALIESLGNGGATISPSSLLSVLASSQLLSQAANDEMLQAVVEFRSGPILLLSLKPEGAEGYVAAFGLDAMSSLGRARLQLKKLLPDLAKAVTA